MIGPDLPERPLFADKCSKNCKLTHYDIKQVTGHGGMMGTGVRDYERARGNLGG